MAKGFPTVGAIIKQMNADAFRIMYHGTGQALMTDAIDMQKIAAGMESLKKRLKGKNLWELPQGAPERSEALFMLGDAAKLMEKNGLGKPEVSKKRTRSPDKG
ncbi:MAG: hypothetical protein WCK46_01040 [Candidatus Adlerbacteria bacterium]